MQRSPRLRSSQESAGPRPFRAAALTASRVLASAVSGGTRPSGGSTILDVRVDFAFQNSYQCVGPAPVSPPIVGARSTLRRARSSSTAASSSSPKSALPPSSEGRSNGVLTSSLYDQKPWMSGSPQAVRGTLYVASGFSRTGLVSGFPGAAAPGAAGGAPGRADWPDRCAIEGTRALAMRSAATADATSRPVMGPPRSPVSGTRADSDMEIIRREARSTPHAQF